MQNGILNKDNDKTQSQVTALTTNIDEDFLICAAPETFILPAPILFASTTLSAAPTFYVAPQSYDMSRKDIHDAAEAIEKIATEVEDTANSATCELFILEEFSKAAATGFEYAAGKLANASTATAQAGDKAKGSILAAWAMIADLTAATFSNEADKLERKVEVAKDVAAFSRVIAHAAHNIAEANGNVVVENDIEDYVAVEIERGASPKP